MDQILQDKQLKHLKLMNLLQLWLKFKNVLLLLLIQKLLLFYKISIYLNLYTFYSLKDITNYGKISLDTTASAKSSEYEANLPKAKAADY